MGGRKKVLIQEDMLSPLSCAVEVARRRQIQSIQAIGLSSDQVKEVAERLSWTEGIRSWRWGPWACWSFTNQGSFSTGFQECISQPGEDQLVKHQSSSSHPSLVCSTTVMQRKLTFVTTHFPWSLLKILPRQLKSQEVLVFVVTRVVADNIQHDGLNKPIRYPLRTTIYTTLDQ